MKISARNILNGTIKGIEHGAINTEVVIDLSGGLEVVAIITKDSAESLGLVVGKEVAAIIKATDVIVATQ